MCAGYETTSTALAFAIVALASHPEVEAKLLAEVDAFPWRDNVGVPFERIAQLPYTRAVIDEAMRCTFAFETEHLQQAACDPDITAWSAVRGCSSLGARTSKSCRTSPPSSTRPCSECGTLQIPGKKIPVVDRTTAAVAAKLFV